MKTYNHFIKDLELEKIKKKIPSSKIRNIFQVNNIEDVITENPLCTIISQKLSGKQFLTKAEHSFFVRIVVGDLIKHKMKSNAVEG
jgi:hypothetical protein